MKHAKLTAAFFMGEQMLDGKIVVENRVHPRVTLHLPVRFRMIHEKKELHSVNRRRKKDVGAETGDISRGGMYILTRNALEVGSILRVYIPLHNGERILATFAEVVRYDGLGAGVQFLTLREEEKEALGAFLERFLSTAIVS